MIPINILKYISFFITEYKKTTEKVVKLAPENLEPFKEKMETFLDDSFVRVENKFTKLEKTKEIFIKTVKFYKFQAKSGNLEECTPQQFFELWSLFVIDFRAIWNRHIQLLSDEL